MLSIALWAVIMLAQAGIPRPSALAGRWTADLGQSQLHANSPVRGVTLEISVTENDVAITNISVAVDGQPLGTIRTSFRTDGAPHLHDELMPGLQVVARWLNERLLETVMTRPNNVVDRVTYEVSQDQRTLVTLTKGDLGEQRIVFIRD